MQKKILEGNQKIGTNENFSETIYLGFFLKNSVTLNQAIFS